MDFGMFLMEFGVVFLMGFWFCFVFSGIWVFKWDFEVYFMGFGVGCFYGIRGVYFPGGVTVPRG